MRARKSPLRVARQTPIAKNLNMQHHHELSFKQPQTLFHEQLILNSIYSETGSYVDHHQRRRNAPIVCRTLAPSNTMLGNSYQAPMTIDTCSSRATATPFQAACFGSDICLAQAPAHKEKLTLAVGLLLDSSTLNGQQPYSSKQ